MMKLRSTLTCENWRAIEPLKISLYKQLKHCSKERYCFFELFGWIGILLFILLFFPDQGSGKMYIDINAPSIRKFQIAIPDFKELSVQKSHPDLSENLAAVISNDLDLSGYFNPMNKDAFLGGKVAPSSNEAIAFKDWSVIGAELLLTGGYTCIGNSLQVEVRLFDIYSGRQLYGKRLLGDTKNYRYLMHRIGDEIIRTLTGHDSIFLTRLAFVSNDSGIKEVFTCDFDGYNLKQITEHGSITILPEWSPGGDMIVYNSYKEGGTILYLHELATGRVRPLSARTGLNSGASWSPSGKEIALTLSHKGNPDIFLIDLKGNIIKQVTDHWGIDVSPAFSPDGDRIAFVSGRSGSPQIYTMDLISGTQERLTFEGNYNASPSWSSLNRIAFVSMSQGIFDIYTMDADGGKLRRLTENQGSNQDPCWSPNGRYIVFSSNRTGRYHLYIMTASGENQRKITYMDGDQVSPSLVR
ncbi:MAG: Tol-Pal system beta propeller repeat protein TolB [Deltaproteobacteria bacterium]|nr:Tol-Pal system beta propeller repeat protein TolB [Deltaproteobacteria bacterium]